MTLLAVLLLFGAPPAAAQAPRSACGAAWQEKYGADWDFSLEKWEAACAKGAVPKDALRAAQDAFIQACMARFAAVAEQKKLAPGLTMAFCAQGKPGESQLVAMTGLSPEPAAEAAQAPATIRSPGVETMGPLMSALKVARVHWQADACFAGLHYTYHESDWVNAAEYEHSKRGQGGNVGRTYVEQYTYYFVSQAEREETYRVVFGDITDAVFCTDVKRLSGPDHGKTFPVAAFKGCLQNVEVDLAEAIKIAQGHGFKPGENLTAHLGVFPSGFFSASRFGGWDSAKLRRVTGSEIWAISGNNRTAFVDAHKGRFRYLAPDDLSLDSLYISYQHGLPCKAPLKSR